MSNGYTNLNPGIIAEGPDFYSSSFYAAKVSPVSSLTVTGLSSGKLSLSVNISCIHKGNVVFECDKKYLPLHSALYDEESSRLLIRFALSDFSVNSEYLYSLEHSAEASVISTVSINGTVYEVKSQIILAACDEFAGIEAHPETLSAFISPDSNVVSAITSGWPVYDVWTPFDEVLKTTGKIIDSIRSMNIICVKKDGYSPEKRQRITPVDMLSGKSSVVATSLELAVLFCSVAEKCGLDSIIVFIKNSLGIVSVYCGAKVKGNNPYILSESITAIRKALDDGELLMFEPAVLSSAQVLDITHASHLASEVMHKAGTDMILSVGIGNCYRSMISSDSVKGTGSDARKVLGEIYSGISDRKVFRMLSGDYSAYDVVPLIGFSGNGEENITVRPMEISEKISDFRDVSDNFASFAFKDLKKKEYNQTERVHIAESYSEFKTRISAKKYVTAGLYEKVFHEHISRICYGAVNSSRKYLICGFMRMTDVKDMETRYFPLAFQEVETGCDYDYWFSVKKYGFVLNTFFASMLSADSKVSSAIDSKEKAFAFFENLAEKVRMSGDYSDVSVIYEYALTNVDLSDAVLWNDINKNGKKMLANAEFSNILAGNRNDRENKGDIKFTFPRFVPYCVQKTLVSDGNTIIDGTGIKEKSDIAVNKAVYTVSKGNKVLVTSYNHGFNDEIYRELENEGLTELMLRLDNGITTKELIALITQRMDDVSDTSVNPVSGILTDYDKANDRLSDYGKAMSVQDPVLGITVPDGILSFYRACDSENGKNVNVLDVGENAFKDLTQHKFNVLFERAEKLVDTASKALQACGASETLPLKHHALYPVKHKCILSEDEMSAIFESISKINSIISDYRETFYDISPFIGIDIADIKNLAGLHALNELYMLVISARELDIPEGLTGADITSFASDANILKSDIARAEAIEYRLKFFGKEIFEDVDALLSGYSHTDPGRGNFIKKFLVKKNNKDILMQYVPDENKNEFNQHDVGELYKLLEEYRQIKARTNIMDSFLGKENSVKLAELIKTAEGLFSVIYPDIEADDGIMADKIGKFCNFVNCVSHDAALSKKLTYARAKFAIVYSENDSLLGVLSEKLHSDFSVLEFNAGILDYQGIGAYLKELEKNLPALEYWNSYLSAKVNADEYMPEFSKYIEEFGVKANTDRVFAASLILPTVEYLADKYDIIKHKKNYDSIKEKYGELYNKASKLSSVNAVISYRQRIKHYFETENLSGMENDAEMTLDSFVNKYKKTVFAVFPIVFADVLSIGNMFGSEIVADVLVAGAFSGTENLLISASSVAKQLFVAKYNSEPDWYTQKLCANGAQCIDASYSMHGTDRALGSLIGVSSYYSYGFDNASMGLITVNGTMRRVSDASNPSEAETCVTKASEIYAKTGKSVAIFALTHGQTAFIKHLIDIEMQNDKYLAAAVENGAVKVFGPGDICFKKFDVALISVGAATDKNGNVGWSYGLGRRFSEAYAFVNAFSCIKEKTVIVCSLSVKELSKLRKCSGEADNLYFAILSASKGITVMDASDNCIENEELSSMMMFKNRKLVPACGRYASKADCYDMESGKLYMYDCDIDGNVYDKLYFADEIQTLGIPSENMSFIDDIL